MHADRVIHTGIHFAFIQSIFHQNEWSRPLNLRAVSRPRWFRHVAKL